MVRSARIVRRATALAATILVLFWSLLAVTQPMQRLGDRLQVALPVVGAACAATHGNLGDFAGRFVAMMVAVHGTKHLLGDAAINIRPRGGDLGFPSGHTAAATFGASALARDCGALIPYAGPLVAVAAGFVGGSRIEARAHDLGQVLAGAAYALVFELSFRTAASRRVLRRLMVRIWHPVRSLIAAWAARGVRVRRYQG